MKRVEIGRFNAVSFNGEQYEFIVYRDDYSTYSNNTIICASMPMDEAKGIYVKPRPELWDANHYHSIIQEKRGYPDQTRLIKEFNICDELFKYMNDRGMLLYSIDMAYMYNFIDKDGFDKEKVRGKSNGKVKRKGRAFKHASKKGEILTKWKNGEFN